MSTHLTCCCCASGGGGTAVSGMARSLVTGIGGT